MAKPALFACSKQDKLPLDVGPTIINNHLGPQDVVFNAMVMNYASTQAAISTLAMAKHFTGVARAPGGEDDGRKGMSLRIVHTKRLLLGRQNRGRRC